MLRPQARSGAARADLLHPQGEAQETAQGRGDPEDLAALQERGVGRRDIDDFGSMRMVNRGPRAGGEECQ